MCHSSTGGRFVSHRNTNVPLVGGSAGRGRAERLRRPARGASQGVRVSTGPVADESVMVSSNQSTGADVSLMSQKHEAPLV